MASLTVAVLALVMVLSFLQLVQQRHSQLELTTRIAERSLTRTIESVEMTMLSLSEDVLHLELDEIDSHELSERLAQAMSFAPHIRQVLLLRDGVVEQGNGALVGEQIDLARLAFKRLQEPGRNLGIQLGRVQPTRFLPKLFQPDRPYLGKGLLPLALELYTADDTKLQLVLAVNLDYIQALFDDLIAHTAAEVTLARLDGVPLVGSALDLTQQVLLDQMITQGRDENSVDYQGVYQGRENQGVRAQLRLSSRYPLVLIQTIHHADTLTLWYENNSMLLQLLVVLVLVVFVAIYLYYRNTLQRARMQAELKLLTQATEQMPVSLVVTDPARQIQYVNPAFSALFGYLEDEVIGNSPSVLKSGLTPKSTYLELERTLNVGAVWQGEFVNRQKSGELIEVSCIISPLRDEQGRVTHHVGVMSDIREIKQAQQAMQVAATVFEIHEGMLVTDDQGAILRANQAYSQLMGVEARSLVGCLPQFLDRAHDQVGRATEIWRALDARGSWRGEFRARLADGSYQPQWVVVSAVKNELGKVCNYVCSVTDITERKSTEQKIMQLAYYDPLTQLPNRRLFNDRLTHALVQSQRSGRYGALILIDLDNFKVVNDTLGHDVGDALLLEVSRRMELAVRRGDTIGRMGGDEFMVILEQLGGDHAAASRQALIVAEKIRAALEEPMTVRGHPLVISASLGMALFEDGTQGLENLMKQADIALYASKDSGRNQVRLFSSQMQSVLNNRVAIEHSLRNALKSRQMQLHIQPQFDVHQRLIGAEALVRWLNAGAPVFTPDEFIPIAERSDLILELGDWVIRSACEMLRSWQRLDLPDDFRLSVNISARQLLQHDFAARLDQALHQFDVPAQRIKLEITEHVMVSKSTEVVEQMSALRELGVMFDMDDFGTGFSSLSYLKRLPIDSLKIDKSFVRDIETDPVDASIVASTVQMAASLGLNVTAEGVETDAQFQFLRRCGCNQFQGYLFDAAMPEEKFVQRYLSGLQHPTS